jgi:hypothetical protein
MPARQSRLFSRRRTLEAERLTPTSSTRPAPGIRRTGVTEYLDGPDHSGLMLAARITLAHFSVSAAMNFRKSAGELACTKVPSSMSRALNLGSASAALISLLSLSAPHWPAHSRNRASTCEGGLETAFSPALRSGRIRRECFGRHRPVPLGHKDVGGRPLFARRTRISSPPYCVLGFAESYLRKQLRDVPQKRTRSLHRRRAAISGRQANGLALGRGTQEATNCSINALGPT